MNPATLVMLIQPLATPIVTAILSDPRPGRVWVKVGVALLMTIIATAVQLQGLQLPLNPTVIVETFLKTLLYNQGVHRLFKHSFDNLENATGNGVGVVADALGKAVRKPTTDPWGVPSVPGEYPEA